MKCPFLIKKSGVFDEQGKKVSEHLEIQECIKNECMVYDGTAKLCSLLSSNMKTGVLIDDVKIGFKSIKDGLDQRIDALGGLVTKSIQTMQEAVLDRFAIFRKQNEVMVLGFDRLSDMFANKLQDIRSGLNDLGTYLSTLQNVVIEIKNNSANYQEALKKIDSIDNLVYSANNVSEFMETEIRGLKTEITNNLKNIATKFDELNKVFSETMIKDFKSEIGKYYDGLSTELINIRTDQKNALANVQNTAIKLEEPLRTSADSLANMNNLMRNLNNNYLESLGKIAGLAEGMRKGVEKMGEGLHESVKDLINEIKKEIGPLEKQYERTFGNVTKMVDKFDELSSQIRDMTKDIQREFKDSFDRQAKLSEYTKDILNNIRVYLEKEEARYKEEQLMHKKKEGVDHSDRATLYYYRGNYELALDEINKALEIEKIPEYLNLKGLLLTETGRLDESQRIFTEALKMEPHLAEINNNLGLLFLKMKRLDEAVVSFQEALKKNPNYTLAYVNLGKVLIDLERFDDAIQAYNRALEIDPSNQEARDAIKLYKEGKIGD